MPPSSMGLGSSSSGGARRGVAPQRKIARPSPDGEKTPSQHLWRGSHRPYGVSQSGRARSCSLSDDLLGQRVTPGLPDAREISRSFLSLQPRGPDCSSTISDGKAQGEASEQESTTPSGVGEVILAINMTDKGVLGCAYYLVHQQALFVMNELEGADVSILESLLIHAQPNTVLLPFKAKDLVMDFFDKTTLVAEGERMPLHRISLQLK
ncbi:hypothetical protein SODALDRAFT_213477 [Sodiomyces alkalinus F11]|uniref:Uncharacterized protein n=1 Tax=Sodiomyces alkalinus (strain CBS 110278 / VKM F-3762 / F11) TaxID=1314773 RepID=A0A3N2PR86_SODAK|nr:hypothetical protein SODALDRAFT_213477 [Sodiomyces alkalinus F11]ROT37029.1 hypothetical protein SODALDRAFT_213477 [Sodiomyces alkalinus F11]